MSQYRRNLNGQTYFFTVVTEQRRTILTTDLGRRALRQAIKEVQSETPFHSIAIVLLPDHLHTVWELPAGDTDYSTRWKKVKTAFTKTWRRRGGPIYSRSESQQKRGEQGLWQRRFFEHTCQDDRDLKRCVDYVHVNPLKHGLVRRVQDWPWSTFHRYIAQGEYSNDWGSANHWHGDEFKYFE